MNDAIVFFHAPWSRALRATTLVACALLALVVAIGLVAGPRERPLWMIAMVVLPLLLLIATALLAVRGYRLSDRAIEVVRPIGPRALPLEGLVSVTGDAEVVRGALRLFGNGGLFAFTGWFWSRRLGRYRMWGTDPARGVVLRWQDRTVVLTPHDPQAFIVRVRKLLELRDGGWR